MIRRLRRFLWVWLRLAYRIEGVHGKAKAAFAFLFGFTIFTIFTTQARFSISVGEYQWIQQRSVAWIGGFLFVICYVFITAGLEWRDSGIETPAAKVRVAEELEYDDDYRMYRLRLFNDGSATAFPVARISRIVTDQGEEPLKARLPLDLQWSHGQYQIFPNHSETVGVLRMDVNRPQELLLEGQQHKPDVGKLVGNNMTTYFELHVIPHSGLSSMVRWIAVTNNPEPPRFSASIVSQPTIVTERKES
jgi:hypothetical protein